VPEIEHVEKLPPAMHNATQAQLDERGRDTEAILVTTLAAINPTTTLVRKSFHFKSI
jgi:hypothetical protein